MIKIENLNDKEFITINDLSETLGTSQNTMDRLCVKGDLKPYKFPTRLKTIYNIILLKLHLYHSDP